MGDRPSLETIKTVQWQKGLPSVHRGSSGIRTLLETALKEGKGCLIGRNGSTELTSILAMDTFPPRPPVNMKLLLEFAGVYPSNHEAIVDWF